MTDLERDMTPDPAGLNRFEREALASWRAEQLARPEPLDCHCGLIDGHGGLCADDMLMVQEEVQRRGLRFRLWLIGRLFRVIEALWPGKITFNFTLDGES